MFILSRSCSLFGEGSAEPLRPTKVRARRLGRLLVVFPVLGGLSPLEPPVDLVGSTGQPAARAEGRDYTRPSRWRERYLCPDSKPFLSRLCGLAARIDDGAAGAHPCSLGTFGFAVAEP